ncbi:MAG: outer-membrane lipoprotein carrier protein LolA [Acidiferrobacterales bacterium]|nr:outer-membrane lipoprotein carrier protein LolA [Acidiferrobacterales bacterium]
MKPLSQLLLFLLTISACSSVLLAAESLQDWLPKSCQYHGEFEQNRVLEELPAPLRSTGRFLFDCRAGVIWHTETPVKNTTIYTSEDLNFRFDREGSVSALKGLVHRGMSTSLRALMGGDISSLNQNFTIVPEPDDETVVEFIPNQISARKHLQKILLRRSDNTIDIELVRNEKSNTAISILETSEFRFQGTEECASIFKKSPLLCESLYFPRKVMDMLQTDH